MYSTDLGKIQWQVSRKSIMCKREKENMIYVKSRIPYLLYQERVSMACTSFKLRPMRLVLNKNS